MSKGGDTPALQANTINAGVGEKVQKTENGRLMRAGSGGLRKRKRVRRSGTRPSCWMRNGEWKKWMSVGDVLV